MAESGGTDYTGLLGLLGAAAIASAGSIYNNWQQRKLQGATNDLAVNLANTAHQREVADLYAAGLNPILSAVGNGAATPSLGTANLDNVLSEFGSSAKGIGDALSRQRALGNESYKLDNERQRIDNELNRSTLSSEINSANSRSEAERIQADIDAEMARDKQYALHNYKYRHIDTGDGNQVNVVNDKYLKDVSDSLKSDIKAPWRHATQS